MRQLIWGLLPVVYIKYNPRQRLINKQNKVNQLPNLIRFRTDNIRYFNTISKNNNDKRYNDISLFIQIYMQSPYGNCIIKVCVTVTRPFSLRQYICNGCTDLQLGSSLKKTLFQLNICHSETIHHTAFHSFCLFDFINKIDKIHSTHIKGR